MTVRTLTLDCGCKISISFNAMDFDFLCSEDVEIKGSIALPCKLHGGND